ncbi:helix-turn-helix domain-containing protein [Salmonella enterica subsp. enterica serovar Abony]|nr:helix-turn-helix domain-containing protein [Salmonella enterica subsp. enterica serovar Bispebjerg]ECJ3935072.1 helix-turn-helix domain-containing protein [Salmonella enterica subsp. enterica]EHK4823616.1 helix-turn-helix domain-containing protein [Salmonella enterica subsp. enterica serovar Abony]MKM03240.1 helix-turn-helix domain-containing protein [Salmonella enterica subsp. enterica serovar Isaszeg]HAF9811964.1 helix-turn-helix domain-containing protein [Salmonella enterica]
MMSTIGSRIRERRNELGLTQRDVGAAVGRSTGAVTQWEADMTKPNGQNLMRLAKLLNCSPEWLLSGKGEPSYLIDIDPHGISFEDSRKGQMIALFDFSDITDSWTYPEAKEYMITTAAVGNGTAYGLRISDDEEICLPNLRVPGGSQLVVDGDHPGIEGIIGKLVLVHHKGAPRCSVKKLMFDGVSYSLAPTNPSFQILALDENTEILGVIKQIVIDFSI